ncbi:MAG TPA: SRPBCC family protein [Acidimicrobiia bacterium]|nr:SRPBCC family protein [Acidimicrobiia bacterium]
MVMRESATAHVDASPAAVFARLTDIARLAEWNDGITQVLEQPAQLTPGAVWKVRMRALGQSWVSRSTLVEFDAEQGRFRHRSQTDDGNPSYADWDWTVQRDGTGTRVTVTVELHPRTFWRKYLLVHLRRPALRSEMRASLRALSATVSA